jgi:hypothetical protein
MEKKADKQKQDLIQAYKSTMGNVSLAVEKVGLSRTTFYNYINDDAEFRNACKDIDERNLDFAESQLLKQIREDNTTSLIFYLKTKGKSRGYVERQEITGKDGLKIFDVHIIDGENQD